MCNALTIAGSDSGGGAGIQADLKVFSALGVYGCSALTALTAQNTQSVLAIMPVPADFVADQIKAVLDDIAIHAIKIGMLGESDIIEKVAVMLDSFSNGAVILDPVMVAKSGDLLLKKEAIDSLKKILTDRVDLITPNLPEAATLLQREKMAVDKTQMIDMAKHLHDQGWKAILIKGGHLEGATKDDLFFDGKNCEWLETRTIDTKNTHGTGCSLSSAIAALSAKGANLFDACVQAKTWLTSALRHADRLAVGKGKGPVHHFHALWP